MQLIKYSVVSSCLSDEMLNRDPDSLWSLKIPWHFSQRVGCNPRCPGQIPSTGPCQSWPPNNPQPLDWLYDSLSSPPVAGVWWAHWRRCTVAAVASSKWMLLTGGGQGDPPHMIVKHFGCTAINIKALYKCIIHSFKIHLTNIVGPPSLISL